MLLLGLRKYVQQREREWEKSYINWVGKKSCIFHVFPSKLLGALIQSLSPPLAMLLFELECYTLTEKHSCLLYSILLKPPQSSHCAELESKKKTEITAILERVCIRRREERVTKSFSSSSLFLLCCEFNICSKALLGRAGQLHWSQISHSAVPSALSVLKQLDALSAVSSHRV